jgi:hypothetical protein
VRGLQAILYRLEGVLRNAKLVGIDAANVFGVLHLGRELEKYGSHVLQYVKGVAGVIYEINAKAGEILGFGVVVGHRRKVWWFKEKRKDAPAQAPSRGAGR